MNHSFTKADAFRKPQQELLLAQAASAAALWSRTGMLKEISEIVHVVAAWPEVRITPSRSGLCLTLGNVTLGRLRWNGRIDLPFTPNVLRPLMAESMVERDLDEPDSERAVFEVRGMADVDRAVWLLRFAYLIGDSKVDVCRADTIGGAVQAYDEHPEVVSDRDFIRTGPTHPA
jgi:hypothetical protein